MSPGRKGLWGSGGQEEREGRKERNPQVAPEEDHPVEMVEEGRGKLELAVAMVEVGREQLELAVVRMEVGRGQLELLAVAMVVAGAVAMVEALAGQLGLGVAMVEAAKGQLELAVAMVEARAGQQELAVAGVGCMELRRLMSDSRPRFAVVDGYLMCIADSKSQRGPEGAVEGRDVWSTCNTQMRVSGCDDVCQFNRSGKRNNETE